MATVTKRGSSVKGKPKPDADGLRYGTFARCESEKNWGWLIERPVPGNPDAVEVAVSSLSVAPGAKYATMDEAHAAAKAYAEEYGLVDKPAAKPAAKAPAKAA